MAETAKRLDVDTSRVRQRIYARSLYAFKHRGGWLVPGFQLRRRKLVARSVFANTRTPNAEEAVAPPTNVHRMEVRAFLDEEIEPVGVLRVETENSIWFVTSERYQRLSREERPRPAVRSIEHRLADAAWHRLHRCWWRVHDDGARQMRLLPEVGPADGVGVVTGLIVAVVGDWTAVVSESSLGQ